MARTMAASYSRPMSFSRVCWAVLVVGACSGTSGPDAAHPTSARAPWRELASEHFTIWTDTSPERARLLVPTMENLRQVVLGVSALPETKSKTFVLAFDSVDEVHEYVPVQFIAYAMSADYVLHQAVIVLAGESLDHDRQVVTHELTHAIMYNAIPNQPTWFAEGIAGYFEQCGSTSGVRTSTSVCRSKVASPRCTRSARDRSSR